MKKIDVSVNILPHGKGLALPFYATEDSAGADLVAAVLQDICVKPLQRVLVPTGLALAVPSGYELQIRPRSGLALKNGVSLVNSPGTIDADYRGEVAVIVINHGQEDFVITRGMRIAQAVIAPVLRIRWNEVSRLQETSRGVEGFGSTGGT